MLGGLCYLSFPSVSTFLASSYKLEDRFEDTSLVGRDLACFFVALYGVVSSTNIH